MAKITFIDHEGEERVVDGDCGHSLMEVAKANDVPGIDAECGGACACGTCHVYIDEKWLEAAGAPTECEQPMLEFVQDSRANSRLACQIRITPGLDGLRVATPRSQS